MNIAKAIVAFATTTAGVTATVFADGTVEVAEVIIAACTVLAATAGVWAVPNRESGEGGMATVDAVIVAWAVTLATLALVLHLA